MSSRGTPHRTIRIEDELWDAAKEVAAERGESLSEVIREALRQYAKQSE